MRRLVITERRRSPIIDHTDHRVGSLRPARAEVNGPAERLAALEVPHGEVVIDDRDSAGAAGIGGLESSPGGDPRAVSPERIRAHRVGPRRKVGTADLDLPDVAATELGGDLHAVTAAEEGDGAVTVY